MRPGIEPGASDIKKLGRKGRTSKGNCEGETGEAGEKSRE